MGEPTRARSAHTSVDGARCASDAPAAGAIGAQFGAAGEVCADEASARARPRPDRALGDLLAAQHDLATARQLHALGLSAKAIRARVRNGLAIALPGSVFAFTRSRPTETQRRAAALLAVGPLAAVHGLTACAAQELLPAPDDPDSEPIHVVAPLGARRSLPGIVVHRARRLAPQDVRTVDGLRMVAPARALLQIAPVVTARRLELAFDRALVNRIMSLQDVTRLLARLPARGQAGTGQLRALVEREMTGTTLTRSQAEERFLALIRSAQLPAPEVNARIAGYEVDFLWRDHGLVVEIDGFRFHATRRAFEHDHGKDVALRAARLSVLRYTPRQLDGEPLPVIAEVARGLS